MSNRLVSVSVVGLAAALTGIFACGGDDSSSTQNPDAKVYMDARVYMDAPGSNSGSGAALGQSCTPATTSSGFGQGDCPVGYVCLDLMGATHPWCSKSCTNGAGDTCAMGYTGPGVASCIEEISFNMGAPMNYCGVTCAGDGVNGCTAATCTGTCPGGLACSGTLYDSGSNAVGSACQ